MMEYFCLSLNEVFYFEKEVFIFLLEGKEGRKWLFFVIVLLILDVVVYG